MTGDHKASMSFLQKWMPEGPWVLTSISTNKKNIETKTFRDPEKTIKWLAKHNEKRNIYFSVNSVTRDLNKKAERENIANLDWLHVDIDPRTLLDSTTNPNTPEREKELKDYFDSERKRLNTLAYNPPASVPPPTVIIDSGGGYQLFWKLVDPFVINGVPEKYEEAKQYNKQLEILYSADNCHNVDRIMRLPGTVNWPDKKKQKKGRVPALATLIEWREDHLYPLGKFTPAPQIQMATAQQVGGAQDIRVSGNIERVADVDDLPKSVPDLCKVVIVQGTDPDKPERFPSRSEALLYVCCELKRSNVDDQMIYSIITDPDFRISESVLEKGSNSEGYALKQIRKANEEAIDKDLRIMNEKHMVIEDLGNRCVVATERYDDTSGYVLLMEQGFNDFRNRYMHRLKEIGVDKKDNPVFMPLGEWWLKNEYRRQYETIVFRPGKTLPGVYNLWQGFRCQAIAGDCSLFLNHVRTHICSDNDDYYNYLIGWMARTVQFPNEPGQVAIILRGGMGTGKTFFAKQFGFIFGRHFSTVSDGKHLFGNFNAHLRECVVLLADEALYAGDKRQASSLKRTITDDTIMIESKGVNAKQCNNCIHLIMTSNDDWVIPAGQDERRFFVLDMHNPDKTQNIEYFGKIDEQLTNGGHEALLHMLLTYDLTNFEVRHVPQTEALRDQKLLSMTAEQDWWYMRLLEGNITADSDGWRTEMVIPELIADFQKHNRSLNLTPRMSAFRILKFFREIFSINNFRTYQSNSPVRVVDSYGHEQYYSRPYIVEIPALEVARKAWSTKFKTSFTWFENSSDKLIKNTSTQTTPF